LGLQALSDKRLDGTRDQLHARNPYTKHSISGNAGRATGAKVEDLVPFPVEALCGAISLA
jgi:hypothetical protein